MDDDAAVGHNLGDAARTEVDKDDQAPDMRGSLVDPGWTIRLCTLSFRWSVRRDVSVRQVRVNRDRTRETQFQDDADWAAFPSPFVDTLNAGTG